ncbi:uncharacterized protein LOC133171522 [Saccostrea echinata]|uniref:uncharacterized protein LOC133171522 n=1 Tax=Saccostrea echinata TaxID=191078 RepID=UPI002A819CB5|nr:uncharacterized protein LOC133171522 [Saccostrea echinata]XP_061162279.1 uncharacterized protein LOC133171522 [Saccostrea echinata]XP_061162288.1 uncharacterized protein LOC133171522 [Saccostrea echinata]
MATTLSKDFAAIFSIVFFGGLFLFICIISAIKAVRDRKKIKKFIKAKEEAMRAVRLKRQAYVNMGQIEESPKHVNYVIYNTNTGNGPSANHNSAPVNGGLIVQSEYSNAIQNNKKTSPNNEDASNLQYHCDGYSPRDSVYSIDTSLRHIASMESLTDDVMKSINKRDLQKLKQEKNSKNDNLQQSCPQSTYSSSPSSANLKLPEDYVTATKTLRRYSYQVACAESTLEKTQPQFAKSEAIIKAYKSNNIAFENVAFNSDRNP